MRSRTMAAVMAPCAALAILAGVACSRQIDSAEAGNVDLSTVPAAAAAAAAADAGPSPAALFEKNLIGAWVKPGGGPGSTAAIVITPGFSGEGAVEMMTDTVRKPTSALDKQETDRNFDQVKILSASSDSAGEIEISEFAFENNQEVVHIFDMGLTIQTTAAGRTLTVTARSARTELEIAPKDGGSSVIDGGEVDLPPPVTFNSAPSWCANSTSGDFPPFDCATQLQSDVFRPTDMPAKCQRNPGACMTCEKHACKIQAVSSCEIARSTCFDSIEQCEFDATGKPAGEVSTVDPDGNPIDCKGSPSGMSVCCRDLTGASRGGGGPVAGVPVPPSPP